MKKEIVDMLIKQILELNILFNKLYVCPVTVTDS